ncbi:MAG: methylenetetrahydrofolate reductase, partial [Clostridia bacterium]|nr:methylenetetrahydrofolate reductase [Clostridia bacterium]
MKIIDIIGSSTPSLSFEVFPPKTSDTFDTVKEAIEKIAILKPSFMSVTYGAGGGTSEFTVSLAKDIQDNFGVTPLAHLTCINSTKEDIQNRLIALKEAGIENILALRGDITPENRDKIKFDYRHANELVEQIRAFGGFCIGGACYPEGHPESPSQDEDIKSLKSKVDAGCQFL